MVSIPTVLFGFELGMLLVHQEEVNKFFIGAVDRVQVLLCTLLLGVILGVFMAGYISYGSGRKITMLSGIALGSLSVIAANVAPNFTVLLNAYLVNGFAFGLYVVAALLYICEIVVPICRIATMHFIPGCMFAGMLISLFTPSLTSTESIVIYATLLTLNALIIASSLVKIPESPRYLAISGSADASLNVLIRMRFDVSYAARELAAINECCRGEARGVELYLQNTVVRRLLCFICACIILFNCSGAIVVPYLLVDFLNYNLVCADNVCVFSASRVLMGLCFLFLFAGVVWHAWSLYKFSRRRVMFCDTLIGACCLFIASLCYVMPVSTEQNAILIVCLLIFIFFYFGGFVSFICVICIELLPLRGREFGMSAIGITCAMGSLLSIQVFKPLFFYLSIYGFFLAGALVAMFIAFLVFFIMPKAEILSLEKIEARVMSGHRLAELIVIRANPEKRERGEGGVSYGSRDINRKKRW